MRPLLRQPAGLACLALYVVVIVVTIAFHEPWADEAHAWLLARENGWFELMWHWLRYEGSGGLWHTLLWPAAQLGLPYEASIKTIAVLCATAGVIAFLRYSPLPAWMTLMVPFTFFVAYQYAVIARSYCVMLLLMSLAAAFLRDWHRKPIRFAVVLIALSQVSIHGTIIAIGFGAQALLDAFLARHDRSGWKPARMAVAIGMVVVGFGVLAAMLVPPPDLNFASGLKLDPEIFTARVIGYGGRSLLGHDVPTAIMVVGFALLIATVAWAVMRGVVFGAVCIVGLCALAAIKHYAGWHEGAVVLVWLFTLWLVWARPAPQRRWDKPMRWMAGAVLALHVGYAAATVVSEIRGTYSMSREVAEYLKRTQRPGETLWGYDFMTIAVQPYFDKPIFANQAAVTGGKAVWLWSRRNAAVYSILPEPLCAGKPELLLTIHELIEPDRLNHGALKACGYVLEKKFSGVSFFQGGSVNEVDYLLYRRKP